MNRAFYDYQAELTQRRRAALWREVDRLKAARRAEAYKHWHGKRADQVEYSLLVLVVLLAIGIAGVLCGVVAAIVEEVTR